MDVEQTQASGRMKNLIRMWKEPKLKAKADAERMLLFNKPLENSQKDQVQSQTSLFSLPTSDLFSRQPLMPSQSTNIFSNSPANLFSQTSIHQKIAPSKARAFS